MELKLNEDRYADLRSRLDAAESILRILVRHVAFADDKARADFMSEAQQYADGMRKEGKGNRLSETQADAMDAYLGRYSPRDG